MLSHASAAALWMICRGFPGSDRGVGPRRLRSVGHPACAFTAVPISRRRIARRTRHSGHEPDSHTHRSRRPVACGSARGGDQRGRQARSGRSGDASRSVTRCRAGRAWVAKLRDLLDRGTFTLTDSELERRFLAIVERLGLPPPLTGESGERLQGRLLLGPELGLVVETDGLRYHRTPAQQARDRLRDQAHTAAGQTPLRYTRAQVRFDPDYVGATLARVARRLASSSRPSASGGAPGP